MDFRLPALIPVSFHTTREHEHTVGDDAPCSSTPRTRRQLDLSHLPVPCVDPQHLVSAGEEGHQAHEARHLQLGGFLVGCTPNAVPGVQQVVKAYDGYRAIE